MQTCTDWNVENFDTLFRTTPYNFESVTETQERGFHSHMAFGACFSASHASPSQPSKAIRKSCVYRRRRQEGAGRDLQVQMGPVLRLHFAGRLPTIAFEKSSLA